MSKPASKTRTMYMVKRNYLAPVYGCSFNRRFLIDRLNLEMPGWKERGVKIVRVTVSETP